MSTNPDIESVFRQWAREEAENLLLSQQAKSVQFEPMWNARQLAEYLGYHGKRPEQGVYELVKRKKIPQECVFRLSAKKILFHPDRIRAWQESKREAA